MAVKDPSRWRRENFMVENPIEKADEDNPAPCKKAWWYRQLAQIRLKPVRDQGVFGLAGVKRRPEPMKDGSLFKAACRELSRVYLMFGAGYGCIRSK